VADIVAQTAERINIKNIYKKKGLANAFLLTVKRQLATQTAAQDPTQ